MIGSAIIEPRAAGVYIRTEVPLSERRCGPVIIGRHWNEITMPNESRDATEQRNSDPTAKIRLYRALPVRLYCMRPPLKIL
jgi:hypothetical protein